MLVLKRKTIAPLLLAGVLSACGAPQTGKSEGATAPQERARIVAARGDLAEQERTTIALFEAASPSVVQVVSRSTVMTPFRVAEQVGGGTGFIWDAQGHVVTNNHVVQAQDIFVRLADGEDVRASVIGRAPQYDLAVLRLARAPNAPALALGESANLRVGQSVFAIGNPFGLDRTLTSGIVSALERRLPTPDGREIADVIQTDAAINPGNSGGPLLDSAGRVIGVNTAIYSPSGAYAGVGFAVPVDTVRRVVPLLISDGRAPMPGIGIQAADQSIMARMGMDGVMVMRVSPGGAAQRAGLRGVDLQTGRPGDVIVGINGKPVNTLADLTNELERVGIGQNVTLSIIRGNEGQDVSVAVEDIGPR